ncbi:class I SAM-dependent methyltransferase [Sideroxydans lithotrophicus]|uniref:Methyltransferase type 11 n=1 Tax=Sideroxydans lithotrophicus (strain ES-1) TaxID=580332 RepID=D5CQ81_SIDLE|nr:class I SAM-dependent methyltransferase [Sideroxydans lithotrophicus]ADE13102.1 Methyltransferase type 11 [Sideroxydans lithotrophicus ES-1]
MDSITSEPRPSCDLCGSEGGLVQSGITDPDGNLEGTWSFRCCANPECGVCWLDPAPPPSELWKAYATYHTHTRKSGQRFGKAMLSLAHRLIRLSLLPFWLANGLKREAGYLRFMTLSGEPAGRLLDVGCGGGRFLNRMKKRGWQVEGTDFDEQATQKVSARYGIKTHIGDLTQCTLPANSFDVVTMSQTIEHLYDPLATLHECLRILKPGGLLVMTTPNALSIGAAEFAAFWRGWEAPRHLHLFSVESLQRLTRRAGFEVTDASTYSAGAAVVYRVSRTNQQAARLSWLDELGLLLWSYRKELQEYHAQAASPHSGQNVLIRARKPII